VIIVTSSDAPSDRAETAMLGASRYFLKPQNLDEYLKLGSVVRELL
jgi:DNA-binding response OmpR family regulator